MNYQRNSDQGGVSSDVLADPSKWQQEELEHWLLTKVAAEVGMSPEEIDVNVPITAYNLDSLSAVTLVGELEAFLECSLSPALFYEHSTIRALAQFLKPKLAQIKAR
jgi:acyl carrier protein